VRDVIADALAKMASGGQKQLTVDSWFDPHKRRLELPMPKPVVCTK
jgi:hypothetical protein